MQTKPGKGKAKSQNTNTAGKVKWKACARYLALRVLLSLSGNKKKVRSHQSRTKQNAKKKGGWRGGNEVEVGRQDIWGGKG